MLDSDFIKQVNRLKIRFGAVNFDVEFNNLLWDLVRDFDHKAFSKIVDGMIAERKRNNSPVLVDFREAVLREQQRAYRSQASQVNRRISGGDKRILDENLKNYLAYLGVESVAEAIKLRAREMAAGKIGKRNAPPGVDKNLLYSFAEIDVANQEVRA